jgi:hypothetical protein
MQTKFTPFSWQGSCTIAPEDPVRQTTAPAGRREDRRELGIAPFGDWPELQLLVRQFRNAGLLAASMLWAHVGRNRRNHAVTDLLGLTTNWLTRFMLQKPRERGWRGSSRRACAGSPLHGPLKPDSADWPAKS